MDRSLFRSLLGAAVVSAMCISSTRAQDGGTGFIPSGKDQGQLGGTGLLFTDKATPDNQSGAFPVCLTQSPPGLETFASLLFLQPSSGNLVYATLINPLPFLTPSWSDQAVNPGFSPAFNVGMRYQSGSGGDIQLAWTHLNTYDTASTSANPNLEFVPALGPIALQALGPSFLIGPPPPFASASAVAHFGYDAVNLDGGLSLSAGNQVRLRFFAGLQGVRINQSLSTNFLSVTGSVAFNDTSSSVFTGVGPRVGMDLHYLAGNLDLLCGIAGSTLIGGMQSHINFVTSSSTLVATGITTPNPQSFTSPDSTRVIPGINARLGASYSIPVGGFGVLRCEAGYQAAVYIAAVNQYSLSEVSNSLTAPYEGTAAIFMRTAVEFQSNFLVHGPYGKISLQF